ncbi:MAG: cobyrinate a,c-diamide synthase [Syntrophomonadaceae bacterium]|nr:cobyrinate a,c-diamide synthase [Syntrophomonadaceae bacterium]
MHTPRIMISGTHSGVGKTSIAVGLMKAFSAKGLRVQPFKIGPDYIDPGYHTVAAGRTSSNLDAFLLPESTLIELYARNSADSHISLIEGVMGLFDGKQDNPTKTSSAYIAKILKTPIILVVDASSMGHSIAALVKGYSSFDQDLNIVGVIANRVGSDRHLQIIRQAIEETCHLTFFGAIKKDFLPSLNKRHLGLLPVWEQKELTTIIDMLGAAIAETVDLNLIIKNAMQAPPIAVNSNSQVFRSERPQKSVPIAIARDSSFNFYYQDALDFLENQGGELISFSPVKDEKIPKEAKGLLLGGGFPEVFAETLASNHRTLSSIREFAISGRPIYAECGGLMYLCEQLIGFDQRSYQMSGVIPATAIMERKIQGLGYRVATALKDNAIAPAGIQLYGHEFHYSKLIHSEPFPWAYHYNGHQEGSMEGYASGNILASYLHLHWAGQPETAARFISRCQSSLEDSFA